MSLSLDLPDNFDLNDDSAMSVRIRSFIEEKLGALAALDQTRIDIAPEDYEVTYLFVEHAHRVANNVKRLCLEMDLGERVAGNMYWIALAHDIGKLSLPVHIWDSKEKPRDHLFAYRRTHTALGAKLVRQDLSDVADFEGAPFLENAMMYHHEQMGGGGTHGLKGDKIPMYIRVLAIAEAYDGYRIKRAHFEKENRDVSPPAVLKRMRMDKGATHYDMDVFAVLERMKMRDYEAGNVQNLNYESVEP